MRAPRLALAFSLAVVALTWGFGEPVKRGAYLDQNLQASFNPVGLQLGTEFFYRLPLVKKEGILWESTKIDVGIKNSLSPAFDFIGPFIDIEPIAIFDLALAAQFAGYFDALGYGFHELSGYGDGFDAEALDDLPAKNAGGFFLSAAPTLKFALGRFAFSNTLHVNYFDVDGGEGYFHEVLGNCVLDKSGVELYNDAYALVRFEGGLMAGLNDSILYVPDSGYRSHTIQAVGVYSRALSGKLELYSALTAGLYLEDRYYEHKPRISGMAGITLAL
jgi:hypothetical protein